MNTFCSQPTSLMTRGPKSIAMRMASDGCTYMPELMHDAWLVMFESPRNEHEMDPGPVLPGLPRGQKRPTLLQLHI